jgi:hypothetical protein
VFNNLVEQLLLSATAFDIRRKHRSIKRLFPDFDAKTKGVEDRGGLRLVDQDTETWKFKIHSGTSDHWYDAYLSFKNPKQTLEKMVKDRSLWVADKTKVDFRKLSKKFMDKADIQLFCSCPSDLWWGSQYIRSLDKYDANYARRKEKRPPSVRNPKKYGMVCKHLDRLLKVLPFYSSTLAKWIKDFYGKDITGWEKESQEEFWGGAKKAQAAMQKRREEAPEIVEPEVEEPEEEPVEEEPKPVTKELAKAVAKREEEKPEEKPKEEEPEKEEPVEEPEEPELEPKKRPEEEEEEEPKGKPKKKKPKEEKPKKTTPKIAPGSVEEPEKPQWKVDTGEHPEEEYF